MSRTQFQETKQGSELDAGNTRVLKVTEMRLATTMNNNLRILRSIF